MRFPVPGSRLRMRPAPAWVTVGAVIGFGQQIWTRTQADLVASLPAGTAPGGPVGPTWRTEGHLLVLVSTGHGSYEVDFQHHPARPGTLLWARPGQAVRFGAEPGLDGFVVGWPRGFLPDLPAVPWTPEDPFGPVCWQLAGEDGDAVLDEITQLGVDCDRRLPADLLRHQLTVVILRLTQVPAVDAGGPRTGPEADTYRRFRLQLETDFHRCRRVTSYAAQLGCSVRTLTRACLAATGRTAKQVIDDRVVLEARRMLAGTTMPVATIAEQLGFDEPTHFGRLFHRATGLPPGTFRAGALSGPDPAVPGGGTQAVGRPV